MGMGQAFTTCMRKYADFSGRARRSEYWWFTLATTLIMFPFSIIFMVSIFAGLAPIADEIESKQTMTLSEFMDRVDWQKMAVGTLLFVAVSLLFLLPSLAAGARRLHDMGQSAAWLLLMLVGLSIVLIVLYVMDSQPGDNQWGPDPKAGERQWRASPYPPQPPASPPVAAT
jgi:uncharacterized membrane protein YhaH (DUF805 family)